MKLVVWNVTEVSVTLYSPRAGLFVFGCSVWQPTCSWVSFCSPPDCVARHPFVSSGGTSGCCLHGLAPGATLRVHIYVYMCVYKCCVVCEQFIQKNKSFNGMFWAKSLPQGISSFLSSVELSAAQLPLHEAARCGSLLNCCPLRDTFSWRSLF